MELTAELAALDFCYLTTTGRVTGRPHTIEIWFAGDGGVLYLLAGGGDRADWVRNLQHDAAVAVRLGDVTTAATASVVTDADELARARMLVFDKYESRYGGGLSRWRDTALPIAVR